VLWFECILQDSCIGNLIPWQQFWEPVRGARWVYGSSGSVLIATFALFPAPLMSSCLSTMGGHSKM
jgi:hypothetical protein